MINSIVQALEEKGYLAEAGNFFVHGKKKQGIRIKKENSNISMTIYPKHSLEKQGTNINDILNDIVRLYEENSRMEFLESALKREEYIAQHIYLGIQKESEEKIVKKMPLGLEGLEVYMYIRAIEDSFVMKIQKEHLAEAGISAEQAWHMAENNTFKETEIYNLGEIIKEHFGISCSENLYVPIPMYVVTNKVHTRGAAGILDRDKLRKLAILYHTKTIIVLPSSIHEMIIIPVENGETTDLKAYEKMVREINECELLEEDILIDRAYIMNL